MNFCQWWCSALSYRKTNQIFPEICFIFVHIYKQLRSSNHCCLFIYLFLYFCWFVVVLLKNPTLIISSHLEIKTNEDFAGEWFFGSKLLVRKVRQALYWARKHLRWSFFVMEVSKKGKTGRKTLKTCDQRFFKSCSSVCVCSLFHTQICFETTF